MPVRYDFDSKASLIISYMLPQSPKKAKVMSSQLDSFQLSAKSEFKWAKSMFHALFGKIRRKFGVSLFYHWHMMCPLINVGHYSKVRNVPNTFVVYN